MSKRNIHKESSNEPSSKKGKRGVDLRVSVGDQVQYQGAFFEVTVLLLDQAGQLHTGESNNISIKKPILCSSETHQECDALVEVENSWVPNLERGRLTFKARINALSRDVGEGGFCICIQSEDPNINSCYSNPITVVSYKLILLNSTPCKWYNQMGGGGNCITLDLECRDSSNQLVTKPIPLEMILIYADDGEPVRTQEILTKSDDSQMITSNGKATMKVRIEHVSRKHQNRSFAIKITPNLLSDPLAACVASITSTSINVLSKITPRDRRTKGDVPESTTKTLPPMHQMSKFGSTSFDENSSDSFSGSSSSSSSSSFRTNLPSFREGETSINGVNVQTNVASIEDDVQDNMMISNNATGGNGGGMIDTIPNNHQNGAIVTSEKPVVQALSNVLGWIDSTLKCLCESKWQQVGYEEGVNNKPDINRPLYTMTNPNDRIQLQLDAYRNKVMSSLSIVLEGVEPLLNETVQPDSSTTTPYPLASGSSSTMGGVPENTGGGDMHHPEPLSSFNDDSPCRPVGDPPDLARSGSNGIPGSVDFDTLVNGAVGDHTSSDQLLPLLRGLSRGFSDYSGQI
mmetsp:Transcript_1352/g.1746  ORF Transcript_1352/g.1746 Transcript_1352/m.1746 type:complete len:573 (+) Transcript_1352:37-1755(+)